MDSDSDRIPRRAADAVIIGVILFAIWAVVKSFDFQSNKSRT